MKTTTSVLLSAMALAALFFATCTQPPDYPKEPSIEFMGFSQPSIAQGTPNAPLDTLAVTFSFTDGDGDLGSENDSLDVFLTDSRDGFVTNFKLPFIPEQGGGSGISGDITVKIINKPFNICCANLITGEACKPNVPGPTDTLSYFIQIRDRAGNFSNKTRTSTLTLLCN